MPVTTNYPVPAPTPYQPPKYGGNTMIVPGTVGPSIPKTSYVVNQDSSGNTSWNTGQVTPSKTVNPTVLGTYTAPPQAQPQPSSGFNWDAYKNSGWNNYDAALADYGKTGKNPGENSGSAPTPPPTQTYNLRGQQVTATTGEDALNQAGYKDSDYAAWKDQFADPSQFLNSIDQEYGSQEQLFGQQENALSSALQSFMKTIEADYGANMAKASAAKESTKGKLGENKVQAERRKQDALNAATRLYNELSTGYRQRFGGATSAGEASQAILGAEQQRQSTGISRDYQGAVRDIERQSIDLDNNYNASIQQLEVDKQRQIQEVQNNFQTNMTAITNNRALSLGAREQAKRQILLDVRNNLAAIEQSKVQYQQQLQMMNEQAKIQLQNQLKLNASANQGFAAGGQKSLADFVNKTNTVTSGLGQNNKVVGQNVLQTNTLNNATGMIDTGAGMSRNLTDAEKRMYGLI